MKLEPVAWIDPYATNYIVGDEAVMMSATSKKHAKFTAPLYAIPDGYVLVPVEPTEEWIANMRKGTIEPQGMDAQAKIIETLRRNYKRWIAAAKAES